MNTIRIIRPLWVLGNAGLLAGVVLSQPLQNIVWAGADVVCAVAWGMAIYHAWKSHQRLWAVGIAVLPILLWWWIFRRRSTEAVPVVPAPPADLGLELWSPYDPADGLDAGPLLTNQYQTMFMDPIRVQQYPTQPLQPTPPEDHEEPLAIRQVLEVIEDAERRHPEW